MRHTLLGFTLTLLAATSAFAQSDGTAVAITNTPEYVAPDASRTPLRTAAQGTVFTVLAEQGRPLRSAVATPCGLKLVLPRSGGSPRARPAAVASARSSRGQSEPDANPGIDA